MRLFIALDIPAEVRDCLSQYVDRVRPFAPDARWSRIESLHVTLKFIGEVSEAKVAEIKTALAPPLQHAQNQNPRVPGTPGSVKAEPFQVEFKGVGFFPNPRSPRVFWAGVHASEALAQLASAVETAVEQVGIARENKDYHPHLTLARAPQSGELRHCFRLLQERLSGEGPPQFGTMTAREFFLYQSRPMRGGSRYIKLQRFGL